MMDGDGLRRLARLGLCALVAGGLIIAGQPVRAKDKEAESAPEGASKDASKGGAEPDISFEEPDGREGDDKPFNPFGGPRSITRKDAVPGYLELWTGLKVPGKLYTTRSKRIKIFDLKAKKYRNIPFAAIKSIVTKIEWEREQPEWFFAEAGDPTKTYTGRSYPARKYAYTVTLLNNMRISGHITFGVPIYVQWEKDKKPRRFILHNRDKGKVGLKLKDLPYVKEIRLGQKAYELAVAEARKLAKEAEAKKKAAAKGSKEKKRGAKPEKKKSNPD